MIGRFIMNPIKNLNMNKNTIFKDHTVNDLDGIEVRGNSRSLKFKIKSGALIEHNNNLKISNIYITVQYILKSTNTAGFIFSFD